MTSRPAHSFRTTLWTQVVAARGESVDARQALSKLCETYYGPVEMFVQRYRARASAGGADEARDLTHEFFAKILEGNSLNHADRTKGRFRSYLLGAVKHFLADRKAFEQALKRGGEAHQQSMSSADEFDHAPLQIAASGAFPPDACFDRPWALAVVQQAIDTLRAEAETAADLARFEVLQKWLVEPSGHDTAVDAARSLDLSDSAFKVAVHRLRKRFRKVVKEHIAATVNDPVEVQDELNYLINALTAPDIAADEEQ